MLHSRLHTSLFSRRSALSTSRSACIRAARRTRPIFRFWLQQQQPLQEARHRAAAQFHTKADVHVLGISLFTRNGMAVDVFEVDQLSICLLVGILLVLALVK